VISRRQTQAVLVGNVWIGGNYPIPIQSMTNIPTKDVAKTVAQIHALEQAGCQIIRVAVLDSLDAEALKAIIPQIHIPLVADIHFDYRLALQSIEAGVAKLRINPGNIGSLDRIKLFVEACKKTQYPHSHRVFLVPGCGNSI
jgi:(E)-4-hydroxy-3-methylbut-2-enyl-diphosphate synthase